MVAALLLAPGLHAWPAADDAATDRPKALQTSEEGRVLLGELNCVSCHAATPAQAAWLTPKLAPQLSDIGSRASAPWLRSYLASPQQALPGATMPDALHGIPSQDRDAAAEALTHHLLSTAPATTRRVMPDRAAVTRGERLYHRVGCVTCHAPRNAPADGLPASALPDMSLKWTFEGLRRFLLDPLASRPSGRMPGMHLTDAEAADIAHYLLRDTQVPAALEVAHYGDRIQSLDDLETAAPSRTGAANGFTLEPLARHPARALRFSGWLQVEQAGEHTFYLAAAGVCRLSVEGEWIIGDDSWEAEVVDGKASMRLDAGWHPVMLDFVPRGPNPPALSLEWKEPGAARGPIPTSRLRSQPEPVAEPLPFVVDAAKAAQGSSLYTALRCAACHESKPTTPAPPALASLNPNLGCLAESPSTNAANYHLDSGRRNALRVALISLNRSDLAPPAAQDRLNHALATFRCNVCHSRNGVGGVTPARDAYFTSSGEDLGDEGRLPPRLDDVGDKLKPAWLNKVISQGDRVRLYMETRMPQFGATNVGGLAAQFIALDRKPRPVPPAPDPPEVQREAGRKLVGTDGLSCIACHRFNRQPGHTLQVIDLITAPERLNEDWFRRFLVDPNLFHPGTRMPSFWPDGVSPLTTLLGGDTDRQHAAIWTYLADGTRAKFPEGMSRQNVELVVGGECVMYRGKLWEAGFRAVAVGYPGLVNIAFDAEEMRLALLWRGRFLNAGPHWTVQGMGQIRPLGTDVIVLPHGAPLAILPGADAPWPAQPSKAMGMRFGGYQLDALRRPTLLYSFRDIAVQDAIAPVEAGGKISLHRTVTFATPPPEGLHFRLAGGRFAPAGRNTWRLDGTLSIHVAEGLAPFVRGNEGKQELLVPVASREGKTVMEVDYAW